ncbi:MAG: cysH, partial [Candidatus Dadabacteria bacterium]|nr:cysH [Candidatus Dadabacteria bacterium]
FTALTIWSYPNSLGYNHADVHGLFWINSTIYSISDGGIYKSIDNRKLCCGVRKVHPLNRMLETLNGWITGIRSDQTQNRAGADKFELDEQHSGILKVNPIIDWKWEQVMDYIKKNNIPYNKLHDKGYPSIGCEPCTRAIKPGEDLRAGRWWWENDPQKECGLHVAHDSR